MFVVVVSHGEYDDYCRNNLCIVDNQETADLLCSSLSDHEVDYLYLLEQIGLEPTLMQKSEEERDLLLENFSFSYEELEHILL